MNNHILILTCNQHDTKGSGNNYFLQRTREYGFPNHTILKAFWNNYELS